MFFSSMKKTEHLPNSHPQVPALFSNPSLSTQVYTEVISKKLRCQTPFLCNVYNSYNKYRLNKREACFMTLACWTPFLMGISFGAGFATPHPPLGLGLLGCWCQEDIGLIENDLTDFLFVSACKNIFSLFFPLFYGCYTGSRSKVLGEPLRGVSCVI